MSPSPFTHPFIQVIMHLTSPVTSNIFVFFSFKVNHWGKIKAALLSSKLLRAKQRMMGSSSSMASSTVGSTTHHSASNPLPTNKQQ
ncbi:hypothetical protein FDP41_009218 [Naegleria fowleri]|uniref:Uncharacterized protein n=1 Tax=Naegleria fowleri TaxID=5763 RepID=A0A6A5BE08_NAEFO|nr:uncharacterized protein FDP41_009218 [Naegleria fowleri]KAF0972315.1 hypothetical protein FDP41_009218 [Naegleria fowleri]CAG4709083.1 unnamed protein product [Naegleria fowleri]